MAELIFLKNKYKQDIIFILETMTNTANIKRILKYLHFDHTFVIEPNGHSGGIGCVGMLIKSVLIKLP